MAISTDVDSDAAIETLSYYRLTDKQKKARTIASDQRAREHMDQ
jgi:hypothetical protein